MIDADTAARREALDPSRSFCVTAPAGSGKTELLTQRILALLARVDRPEQVLAITFTRKAAAEMRDRLVEKLHQAKSAEPVTEAHEQVTRDLALAVLEHARDQQWSLDPEVFNLRTIDSLCGDLTRQMPVMSALGGQISVTEQHRPLFEMAVAALMKRVEQADSAGLALRALLLNFDNDWERLRRLLVQLLERRGDWGPRLGMHHSPEQSEQDLLKTVQELTEAVICRVAGQLADDVTELEALTNFAAGNLDRESVVLSNSASTLSAWRHAIDLMLKKDGDWRSAKGINKTLGFPVGSDGEKSRLRILLEKHAGERFRELLIELRRLPQIDSADQSWQLVLHLSHLLPILLAELLLVFQAEGKVDYTHIALAAETALGPDEEPTDLALRLDYQIEHVLIDEFQDTSDQQFRLLHKLTRGWAEHNQTERAPRTLFLVGDGMQSIYGFRYANVSLFLRARDHGIGGVLLEPLALKRNFRSQQGVVDWVNNVFSQLLPPIDDLPRGRVSHSSAIATHASLPGEAVSCNIFPASEGHAEADFLAQTILKLRRSEPTSSITILVRARSHALPIIAALKSAGVDFVGRDLEPLKKTATVNDLLSLCHWFANPSNEVAALALLRAPFCGLSLPTIHLLWQTPRPFSLRGALRGAPKTLGDSCQSRIGVLLTALDWGVEHRDRLSLPVWMEQVWLRLGADKTIAQDQHDDALRFFAVLREAEVAGVGLDIDWLLQRLDKLYAEHPASNDAVQIMTLHKSKGLQFDYVFVPVLHKSVAGNDRALLRWHLHVDRSDHHGDLGGLLIAADDRQDKSEPSLYNYLSWLQSERDSAELRRLLYVGVTRARKRVWLTGEAPNEDEWPNWPGNKTPFGILRAAVESQTHFHDRDRAPSVKKSDAAVRQNIAYLRLPDSPSIASSENEQSGGGIAIPATLYRKSNLAERVLGTAVHRVLELISQRELIPKTVDEQIENQILLGLQRGGLVGEALQSMRLAAIAMLNKTLASEEGQWVLSAHDHARNEWALWQGGDTPSKRVIDRTFIDRTSGVQWIIDYKTSKPQTDESHDAFIAREVEHYRSQLLDYQALLAAFAPMKDHLPKIALFFVNSGKLVPIDET